MKKFLFVILFLIVVVGGVTFGTSLANNAKSNPDAHAVLPAKQTTQKQEATPTPKEIVVIPKHVKIPAIHVDTDVEPVGMDSKGRMDVPKDADNVSWYQPGFLPGAKGSAVLAGHYDKESGDPAVFYEMTKLKPGDEIIVSDANGKSLTFSVVKQAEYPYDTFPIKEVFGPSDKPMLNLITCQGEWNEETQYYSHRGVVYAELVE